MRTDPKRHRIAFLSIPRDLRVEIPGYGSNKINAAFQLGGPALAMRTIRALTGLQPNHVAIVDFDDFRTTIDALGGIDDRRAEADRLEPLRLPLRDAGPLPASGRAGASSRASSRWTAGARSSTRAIRENRLDPSENDLTRGERQQEVVQAMTDKLVSPGTFVRAAVHRRTTSCKPLTTDLSAGELLQLGWVKFRANSSRALHCRLGGELSTSGGQSVIIGDRGEQRRPQHVRPAARRAQPPPPGSGPLGPGCVVGSAQDRLTQD